MSVCEAKRLRKEAEENAEKLRKRIDLLREEEIRTLKKVDETRKRAREIMQLKKESEERRQQRIAMQARKEAESKAKTDYFTAVKEEQRAATNAARANLLQKLREQVAEVKETKAQHAELIEKSLQETLLLKNQTAQRLKDQLYTAKRQRELNEYEKQAKFRADFAHRVQRELEKKGEIMHEIASMEEQEMELIQRLQNTQSLQKSALKELEEAAKGPISEENISEKDENES